MHDNSINLAARSFDNVHFVGEFDDADLGSALSIFIPNTEILFGLEVGNSKLEEAWIDAEVGNVGDFTISEGVRLHVLKIRINDKFKLNPTSFKMDGNKFY